MLRSTDHKKLAVLKPSPFPIGGLGEQISCAVPASIFTLFSLQLLWGGVVFFQDPDALPSPLPSPLPSFVALSGLCKKGSLPSAAPWLFFPPVHLSALRTCLSRSRSD